MNTVIAYIMSDKYRMNPTALVATAAFVSGVEASGVIGAAGDGHVYEIISITVPLTLGADAGLRTPSLEVWDSAGGNRIFAGGVANSGISKPAQTNLITGAINLTSRAYGGGEALFDHQNIELPSFDNGGMIVNGGAVVITRTVGLDSSGASDTYGSLVVYGRKLKLLR